MACALGGLTSGQTYDITITAYDGVGDWSGNIGDPVSQLASLSTTYVAGTAGTGVGPPTCAPLTTARMIAAASPMAGGLTAFDVEVTVGAGGVPEGGGISVGIHHGADWPTQIHASTGKSLVAITSTGNAVLDLERFTQVPAGTTPALFGNAIFHRSHRAGHRHRRGPGLDV